MPEEFLPAESDEFGTPDSLWLPLHEEFNFTVDACASRSNTKLPKFYTQLDSALDQEFVGERVFCNPPYSRGNVKQFFHHFRVLTTEMKCRLAVLLIPTYTDRTWYTEYRHKFEARFIPYRVHFVGGKYTARGNHMFVIFRNKDFCWWTP